MTIRWITQQLGTAPGSEVAHRTGLAIVDVRDLVDKGGNRADAVRLKIEQGAAHLAAGATTVVCCDYGISRSNAVAAGILARHEGVSLESAVRRVQQATGETEIKLEPLSVVRAALGEGAQRPDRHSVLMTGGSGFVGTALRRRLETNRQVTAPSHEDIDVERGSTALDSLAGETMASAIIHLANPRVYTSNVALGRSLGMLRNAIDVALNRKIPLIYLSSWEVYAGHAGDLLADEATPLQPRGPYGESKFLAETLIGHLRRTAGLSCALLRSATVYGAGANRPKFIHTFVEKARRNDPIMTHRYRNGDPTLDLLPVDDLAVGLERVLDTGFIGDLNFGSGAGISTPEVASMIVEALGSRSAIGRIEIDSETARVAMNAEQAQKVLGWTPAIGLKAGLAAFVSELTRDRP